jgi:hypothetical protein
MKGRARRPRVRVPQARQLRFPRLAREAGEAAQRLSLRG